MSIWYEKLTVDDTRGKKKIIHGKLVRLVIIRKKLWMKIRLLM